MSDEYPYAHFEKDHLLSLSWVTEIGSKFTVSCFTNTGSYEDLNGRIFRICSCKSFCKKPSKGTISEQKNLQKLAECQWFKMIIIIKFFTYVFKSKELFGFL